jgi:phosphoglucomutase
MTSHPLAGKPASPDRLVDVGTIRTAYHEHRPDVMDRAERVSFGSSGHRGSSLRGGFNEAHVLAITQAVCDHRRKEGITGPVFLGRDTHALSEVALATTLEVLAANGVETMIDAADRYTPTPLISHAVLRHNIGRPASLADGIAITPSHNPPGDGGFKYTPPHGGPPGADVTRWIEDKANRLLANDVRYVPRMAVDRARKAPTTHSHDYVDAYIAELGSIVDMDAIRRAKLRIGVDPLGGASVALWRPIAERYGLDVELVNDAVDPTFRFVPLDADGEIRMDCSSPWTLAVLIGRKDSFDIAFANDPDADRGAIVTPSAGLMNPNEYLAAAISYLFTHRPAWRPDAAIGKTVVSSSMIDRVAVKVGRDLVDVPIGFRWFVPGLLGGLLGFAGDERAGASFLRRDGTVWTTDRDGIVMNLLAVEMTAVTGRDPSELYADLNRELGPSVYARIDAPATPQERTALTTLSEQDVRVSMLGGEPVEHLLTSAPGNRAAIGGLKISAAHGWFAACPAGTEAVYRLYAESFRGLDHLRLIQQEAQAIIGGVLATVIRSP